jgi:hypothetical protein
MRVISPSTTPIYRRASGVENKAYLFYRLIGKNPSTGAGLLDPSLGLVAVKVTFEEG